MARWSKTLTPETEAAFLAALAGGALVSAAARGAGVAVSTLYWRRGREPLFAAAWAGAVEVSSAPYLPDPVPRPGPGQGRRAPFGARKQARFLALLARDCDTRAAAAGAGVHPATIYRLIRRDPEFARRALAALAHGYGGLERELAAARRRPRRFAPEPVGWPAQDPDEMIALLGRWRRRDGGIGWRRVRRGRMKRWEFDDAIALLDRKLRAIGARGVGVAD